MSQKEVPIKVVFYFHNDPDRQERLDLARTLIKNNQGERLEEHSRMLRSGVEEVMLTFWVLPATALLHHAFDSVLNKEYRYGGCGAAEVARMDR